jgi:hypothetical protein
MSNILAFVRAPDLGWFFVSLMQQKHPQCDFICTGRKHLTTRAFYLYRQATLDDKSLLSVPADNT